MRPVLRSAAGFTLVEAIIAIVITGIVAGIVAVFIARPVQGYADSVRRAELTDAADVALRRMTRDIRLALPNSLRVTNGATNFIEFIMTSSGGRYRDGGDGSTCGNFLYTTNVDCGTGAAAETAFDVLGAMPANPAIAVNDFIVVYNLGPGYEPANAYRRGEAQCDATPTVPGCNIAQVSAVAGNLVTLDANSFAVQSPPLPSSGSRFQVVPGDVRAVTYACPAGAPGSLTRYWNYGFNAAQPTPPGAGSSALLATNATCAIEYTTNATGRNGVLSVQLTLSADGESVTLFQQIHVDNAP
jgi:MSHA biogenesis protein MshO